MDALIAVLLLSMYILTAAALVYLALKKTWLFILLLGVAAILCALPAGYLIEININDWYGGPSGEVQGIGYVIAALMGIAGVVLMVIGRKRGKVIPQK